MHAGLLNASSTIYVKLLADSSMVQIHPGGLRHIKPSAEGVRIVEWNAPAGKKVRKGNANSRQVAFVLVHLFWLWKCPPADLRTNPISSP